MAEARADRQRAHRLRPPAPELVRSRASEVNDGVLAVTGFGEGLAHFSTQPVSTVIAMAGIAGAISVAGVKWAEVTAEREVQLKLAREEARLIELSPEEEVAELTAHFEAKGVSHETAGQVARELSAADALSAQLETEYGISDLLSPSRPFTEAMGSALSFLAGALVPILLALLVPRRWVEEYLLAGAAASLVVTSIVLSRLGSTRTIPTVLRSLAIGLATLGTTTVIGILVS